VKEIGVFAANQFIINFEIIGLEVFQMELNFISDALYLTLNLL